MESIGALLKEAREAKGYSIEQVARDTNIAKRYLEAMEREDTTVFPGETYFIGFLRNYADFLGLDPQKLIGLYRNLQIQEQPPPMEELLEKPRRPLVPILLIVVAVVLLAGAGWFFFGEKLFSGTGELPGQITEQPVPQEGIPMSSGETYEFRDEILERGFTEGDVILVTVGSREYPLLIKSVGPPVEIVQGDKTEKLEIGMGTVFDLSGDGVGDLKIFPRQLLQDEGKIVLYLDKYIESADPVVRTAENPAGEEPAAESADQEEGAIVPVGLGSTSEPERAGKEIVLMEADRPEPFDLDVVFRGLCLLRYVADNELREERYFHKSEVFKLEVERELRLWISNAGSFKGKIRGTDVPLGNPGEVATRLIRWERQGTGKYQLKLIPMY